MTICQRSEASGNFSNEIWVVAEGPELFQRTLIWSEVICFGQLEVNDYLDHYQCSPQQYERHLQDQVRQDLGFLKQLPDFYYSPDC